MAIIQGHAMQSSSRGFYPKEIEGSLRFNSLDGAYLQWTPDGAGTSGTTFTISVWFKISNLSPAQDAYLFSAGSPSTSLELFYVLIENATNDLRIQWRDQGSSTTRVLQTSRKFRDPSAWYHLVISVDTNASGASDRMKVYINGELETSFASDSRSTLNSSSSLAATAAVLHTIGTFSGNTSYLWDGYMAEYFFIDGTAHTASDFGETKNGVWVPKNVTSTDFTMGTNGFHLPMTDDTEVEAFNTVLYRGTASTQSITGTGFSPDLVWLKNRDATQHHNLFDTVRGPQKLLYSNLTNAEATSTTHLNSFDSDGFTVGSATSANGSGNDLVAWCWDAGANNNITGHSSVTYTANNTGQTISGFPFSPDLVWIKSRSVGQSSYIGDSVRGSNGFIQSDSTGAETTQTNWINFLPDGFKLNSLYGNSSTYDYVAWGWDAGNSDPVSNTTGDIASTVKASTTDGFSIVSYTGNATVEQSVGHGLSAAPDFVLIKNRDVTTDWQVYHSSVTTADNIQLELNNTGGLGSVANLWDVSNMTSTTFGVGSNNTTNGSNAMIAYCWHDVTGKQKFGTYTGNGSTSGPSVTLGFRAGWLLIKRTDSASVNGWYLYDGSRNTFSPWGKILLPNSSGAEGDNVDDLTVSDTGFTLTDAYVDINANGGTYIYAAFAGSYSDYITDYNTDGSIDSRVKASDTTGFSIVSYVGTGANATVGHGLSAAPDLVIVKSRTGTGGWITWTNEFSGDQYLTLQTTNAVASQATIWNSTVPSSTAFSVGTHTATNGSGQDYIAYCWTETAGVSKFGSYTGNGSSDGPEVTGLGFKPALVLAKRTNGTNSWWIVDNTRNVTNPILDSGTLYPNSSQAEPTSTNEWAELLSDGFKIKSTFLDANASGGTYIYAAFADTREAAFWLDQSSNDNDWQPVNLDHNDTLLDSPTNNFATLNPLTGGSSTTSNGNLETTIAPVNGARVSTFAVKSGQWYCEMTPTTIAGYFVVGIGVPYSKGWTSSQEANAKCIVYTSQGNLTSVGAWSTSSSTVSGTYTTNDVIGIALDMDANTIEFYKNGTSVGSATIDTGDDDVAFLIGNSSGSSNGAGSVNFGQLPFKYGPPA